jgi:hypothetical protein
MTTSIRAKLLLGAGLLAAVSGFVHVGPAGPGPLKIIRELLPTPPEPIVKVGEMVVSRSGTLYLVDAFDNQRLLVYRPDSTKVDMLGRNGRGPGEFAEIKRIGLVGDTVWAADDRTQRTTFFAPDGGVLRIENGTTYLQNSVNEFWLPILAVVGDGTFITQRPVFDTARYIKTLWLRVAPTGDVPPFGARIIDTLAELRAPEPGATHAFVKGDRRHAAFAQPFAGEPLVALAPDGRLIIKVTQALPASAQASYLIEGRDLEGKRFRVSVPYKARQLLQTDVNRAWERLYDSHTEDQVHWYLGRFNSDSSARRAFDSALLRPKFVPPVRAVLVGSDHSIWVQREDADVTVRWDVFDETGKQLGWADLPDGARVRAVTRHGAWGFESYSREDERVVRYRVVAR